MIKHFKEIRLFFVFFIVFLLQTSALAEPFVRTGQGIRNIGMGNVGIALSHDENALFYNPAGLARVEEVYGSLNLLVGASEDVVRAASNASVNQDDVEKVGDIFELVLDKTFYIRAMGSLNLMIPIAHSMTFGASSFYDSENIIALENAVLPQLSLGFRLDQGQAFGVSIPITDDNSLILGLGARVISKRMELPYSTFTLSKIISAGEDAESLFPKGASEPARGVGGDLGMQWRIPGDLQITLGAVAQSIGGMKFLRAEDATTPKDREMEIGIGLSIQPEWGPFRLLSAVDIKDLTRQGTDDNDFDKRLHTGLELGFIPIDSTASFIAVRSGYNQGYSTFGLEINPLIISRFLTIQYAVYGEEIGDKSGDLKNSRALIQISLSLGEVLL